MEIKYFEDTAYEIVVIGAGHAGIEAALAASRLGHKTLILTMDLNNIGDLPCNPNIGGTGKGHLVREIDALGGEMAINIDKSFIQSRMLNTSKGPAVHSLRVQADKRVYHEEIKKVLENQKNLTLYEGEAIKILVEEGKVTGVVIKTGEIFPTRAIILATGTYLKGLILMGEVQYEGGPHGTQSAKELSFSLRDLGIMLRRFKTGTPARVHRDSLDFSVMEVQKGDTEIVPFSFMNMDKNLTKKQEDCYLTYTTLKTKEIIMKNLHRSPMYAGVIEGIGPRYCPSIEDKIVRFADKETHQVFIEPEGLNTKEVYVQGISSTLPVEIQKEMYKTITGLENVQFMRPAYGIEYDCIDPTILKRTLEHQKINNLFFAGQINGSSGYEEAAAQGIIAGINAVQNLEGKKPFILDRSDAYIGVLIDDLVTKGTNEPYRMMTARSEYRLTLRQDNADLRLTEKAYKIGLASKERYERMCYKKNHVAVELERLKNLMITPTDKNNYELKKMGTMAIKTGTNMEELLRRPELDYEKLKVLDNNRPELSMEIVRQVEIQVKYSGYIKKQMEQIEQFKKMEGKGLLSIKDYAVVKGLRKEAIQKLNQIRPENVGQAGRISGVSPADINVLLIHLEVERRKNQD
ncbi:tRNA uridine 5-carboxymethylaminomethyl modification enzyme GidA [Peptostreptococcaceae bacterium oral taxon 113 str. W5053]|nr:tRNA uridine 5-carboxymethylaminomethyl modification enzyme GidA [Peptostreptococcaceae bacterium oral taxon 113 str. W5053]